MTKVNEILEILKGGYKPEYRQKIIYSFLKPKVITCTKNTLVKDTGIPYNEVSKCLEILGLETGILSNFDGWLGDFYRTFYHLRRDLSEGFKTQLKEGLEKILNLTQKRIFEHKVYKILK